MKSHLILLLILIGVVNSYAQCDYDYKKQDAMTDEVVFKTKKFDLSKEAELDNVYLAKKISAQIEKNEKDVSLIIDYKLKKAKVKYIVYINPTDSLMIKFENKQVITTHMNTMALMRPIGANMLEYAYTLSYSLTPEIIENLKSGIGVKVLRLRSQMFDIDITDFEIQLSEKFTECWVE